MANLFNGFDPAMQSLLDSPVLAGGSGKAAAQAVSKKNYNQLLAFQNVTSYSMQGILHTCPRKFQITKMRAATAPEETEREGNTTFAFGHAVGAGVAVYDQTHDLDEAIFAAFLAWDIDLLQEPELRERGPRKLECFHHAVWALMCYPTFVEEETDLDDYEVIKLEAVVAVDLENGFFYTGHVDELLRSRSTGRFKVKENKTSGFGAIDPALYSNSDQALSYSIVVDAHGAAEYDVLYTIYSKPEQRWIAMPFVKTPLAKIEWLQGQALTATEIENYSSINFFPKRGANCLQFQRRCQFYEECDLDPKTVFGCEYGELPRCNSFEDLEAVEHIDYRVTWSQIVANQKTGEHL